MRNAEELKTFDGLEHIASVPNRQVIIGMVVKNDTLYVASSRHLYKFVAEKRLERANHFKRIPDEK